MLSMPAASWWRLLLWLVTGVAIYASWGWFSGRLRKEENFSQL